MFDDSTKSKSTTKMKYEKKVCQDLFSTDSAPMIHNLVRDGIHAPK
jgi:hypothetical protein